MVGYCANDGIDVRGGYRDTEEIESFQPYRKFAVVYRRFGKQSVVHRVLKFRGQLTEPAITLGLVASRTAPTNRIKARIYALGEKTLASGRPEDAEGHFKDAIRRKDDERLFYYGLAEAQIEPGEFRRASRSLDTAREYSTSRDMQRYRNLSHKLSSVAGES